MKTQRKAVIMGASGLTGSVLLKMLLASDAYSEITAPVRRELAFKHPKLRQHITDFSRLDDIAPFLVGDDAFCCLGTTMRKAGGREAFRAVDYDLVTDFARLASSNGMKQFFLVSSMGADPNSMVFYSRVKGEAEREVCRYPFRSITIFRPSILAGERNETRPGERIGLIAARAFNALIPPKYRSIRAEQVAAAMLKTALQDRDGIYILESDILQQF